MQRWVEENGGWKAVLLLLVIVIAIVVSLCGCVDFDSEAWKEIWSGVSVAYADEPEVYSKELIVNGEFDNAGEDWTWWSEPGDSPFEYQEGLGWYAQLCPYPEECYAGIGSQEFYAGPHYGPWIVSVTWYFSTSPVESQHPYDYYSCFVHDADWRDTWYHNLFWRTSDDGSTEDWVTTVATIDDMPVDRELFLTCYLDTNSDGQPSTFYILNASVVALNRWPVRTYLPVVR